MAGYLREGAEHVVAYLAEKRIAAT
jgi:hypothetical protein